MKTTKQQIKDGIAAIIAAMICPKCGAGCRKSRWFESGTYRCVRSITCGWWA